METSCKFDVPVVKHPIEGLMPGMFDNDLTFTFEAKYVHVTDPKEIDQMLWDLDIFVADFKLSARKALKTAERF
jgi:hypothetical protein